jgi:hypothetical protein
MNFPLWKPPSCVAHAGSGVILKHCWDYIFGLLDWFSPWLTRSRLWGGTICFILHSFYRILQFLTCDMDNNWPSLRHLAYSWNLTIVIFLLWGVGEAKPSSQTICGWFFGSCTSLMLDISQPWTSVTNTAYINLLYFQILKNSWLNHLLHDIWVFYNMHECLE